MLTLGGVFWLCSALSPPSLSFSTYGNLPVEGFQRPRRITRDAQGAIYVAGEIEPLYNYYSERRAFVLKLDATGSQSVYAVVLGAVGERVDVRGLTADDSGHAWLLVDDLDGAFPTTPDRLFASHASSTVLARLSPEGALEYATALFSPNLLTWADAHAVALARAMDGALFVAGWFDAGGGGPPTSLGATAGAFQQTALNAVSTGFVMKVAPDAKSIVWATYLGGSTYEELRALALAPGGEVVVAGTTNSADFPTTPLAHQLSLPPTSYLDATVFVTRLSPDGSAVSSSTFFGGAYLYMELESLRLDAAGAAYVSGIAEAGLPTTPGALLAAPTSGRDGFVASFDLDGALLFSTFLGLGKAASVVFAEGGIARLAVARTALELPVFELSDLVLAGSMLEPVLSFDALGNGRIEAIDTVASDALVYCAYAGYPYPLTANAGNVERAMTTAWAVVGLGPSTAEPMPALGERVLSFATEVGSESEAQEAFLGNFGDGDLHPLAFMIEGPFVQRNDCPASLPRGSVCRVAIASRPEVLGAAVGSLVVTYADGVANDAVALSTIGKPAMLFAQLDGPESAERGAKAVYTASAYSNTDAGMVTMTFAVPEGATLLSLAGERWLCDAAHLRCTRGGGGGADTTISLELQLPATGNGVKLSLIATHPAALPYPKEVTTLLGSSGGPPEPTPTDSTYLYGDGFENGISLAPGTGQRLTVFVSDNGAYSFHCKSASADVSCTVFAARDGSADLSVRHTPVEAIALGRGCGGRRSSGQATTHIIVTAIPLFADAPLVEATIQVIYPE